MVGDFNAHHTAWNCESTDANGERFLNEFEDEDMFIVNFDTLTRMGEMGQRDSNLDLIWCNSKILDMITYQVGEDSRGSNHCPVFFKCDILYKTYVKRTNRITSKRTDWGKYAGILEDREYELESEVFRELEWEDRYDYMIDSLKKAAFEATGKRWSVSNGRVIRYEGSGRDEWQFRQRRRRRNPADWWDDECDQLVSDRNAYVAYRKHKCLNTFIEKKRCAALVTGGKAQKERML